MPRQDETVSELRVADTSDAGVLADRQDRYRQAATLLRQWREDESGYDEKIWPLLEEEFHLK